MSEAYEDLTETEQRIAKEWGNGLDMMARLINGPVSAEYFHAKFPVAVRSLLAVADLAGIDPNDPGVMRVHEDAPEWDVHKVWDRVVRHESSASPALNQIWLAMQYDTPYTQAEYPLTSGKPFFPERPRTLDDPHSVWHVQYGTPGASRLTNATVRGRSASDAVRNAHYVYPQATIVQINALKHDPDGEQEEHHTVGWWAGVISAVFGRAPRSLCGEVLDTAAPSRSRTTSQAVPCPECRDIAGA